MWGDVEEEKEDILNMKCTTKWEKIFKTINFFK